jgi:hypothetical protein
VAEPATKEKSTPEAGDQGDDPDRPTASDQDAGEQEAGEQAGDDAGRQRQIVRLRTQQIGLQAVKTGEELQGIATSLDDLLEEMANNRVDSVDRSARIGGGVRDPLRAIVAGDLAKLRSQIAQIERRIAGGDVKLATADSLANNNAKPEVTADVIEAVKTAEDVLLQLTAVLEKMLDLESFNEILDMVRELIESQDGLIEKTKKEQKARVLDLFD